LERLITNNNTITYETTVKRDALDLRGRQISITDKIITFDDRAMFTNEVTAMRYGTMQMKVFHGIRTGKYYKIELLNNKREKMGIFFGPAEMFAGGYNAEETYDNVINALWHTVKKRLVREALEKLEKGFTYRAGDCLMTKEGLYLNLSFLFTKKNIFVPWERIEKEISYGKLYLYPQKNKLLKCKLSFLKTWNAVVLYSLLEFLLHEKRYKEIFK
jgi:hypothetical protein